MHPKPNDKDSRKGHQQNATQQIFTQAERHENQFLTYRIATREYSKNDHPSCWSLDLPTMSKTGSDLRPEIRIITKALL